jgi:hypothetical protein
MSIHYNDLHYCAILSLLIITIFIIISILPPEAIIEVVIIEFELVKVPWIIKVSFIVKLAESLPFARKLDSLTWWAHCENSLYKALMI